MKKVFTAVVNADLSVFFPYALAIGSAVAIVGAGLQVYLIIKDVI